MESERRRLIDTLDLPADLRTLGSPQLRQLAQEIRQEIITTISRNGGHLGPSLGAVELAIALHAELDTPRDVIIWDVGHQAYAHKLLTGRLAQFRTIRTHGGLSGFPTREEGPYDAYGTGHSSTSISAALGMLLGSYTSPQAERAGGQRSREGLGGKRAVPSRRVVAVIGDGALTGGMAYEALNHAGHLGVPLVVVLNDNTMSIEKNVGAISNYLSRLRTDPNLYRMRRELERRLRRLPGVGDVMAALGEQLKDGIKAALVPGMLFEELGFTYVGVVDGHDIDDLRASLRRALAVEKPVLLHCRTVKGKGFPPAEQHPGRYHGVPGASRTEASVADPEGPSTFTRAFGEALVELARGDDRVVGITAAMATGTGLDLLREVMPERFYDVGIAEAHAVGLAAGLAAAGKRPVVALYSTFLQRAYDQLIIDVCLQDLPVVLAIDRAGLVGEDGPTHHGAFDLSFLRVVPNLTVLVPTDESELQRMLATALEMEGPCAIRYPRTQGRGVRAARPLTPFRGPWVETLRSGSGIAVLAVGPLVYAALEAAEKLAKGEADSEGRGLPPLDPSVIAVRRVRPLTGEDLAAVLEGHSAVVTLEDNALVGGFGSAVLEVMAESDLWRPLLRLGLPDAFVGHGPVETLRREVGLTAQDIADAIRRLASRSARVK